MCACFLINKRKKVASCPALQVTVVEMFSVSFTEQCFFVLVRFESVSFVSSVGFFLFVLISTMAVLEPFSQLKKKTV